MPTHSDLYPTRMKQMTSLRPVPYMKHVPLLIALLFLGMMNSGAYAEPDDQPPEGVNAQVLKIIAAKQPRMTLVAVLDIEGPELTAWLKRAEGHLRESYEKELKETSSPVARRKIQAEIKKLKLPKITRDDLTEEQRDAFASQKTHKTITSDQLARLLPPELREIPQSVPEVIAKGRALGADWIVQTKVSEMGPILKLDWDLYEVTRGEKLASHHVWSKDPRALISSLDDVSARLYLRAEGKLEKRKERNEEVQRDQRHREFLKKMFTRTPRVPVDEVPISTQGGTQVPEPPAMKDEQIVAQQTTADIPKAPKTPAELAEKRANQVLEELAEETRRLEERLEKARKIEENLLEVRIKDGQNEWADLKSKLGVGPSEEQLKRQEGRWTWNDIAEMMRSELDPDQQRSLLLAFINTYSDLDQFRVQIEEAQLRYTWLNSELQWVTVRDGHFLIGSPHAFDDEWPMQWIDIKAFQGGISEVTNAQYRACVLAGRCSPPHWDDDRCHIFEKKRLFFGKLPKLARRGDMPVVCVTWQQAKTYAEWVGGRLFSESEWEFTARSGDRTRVFPWGKDEPTCERAIMAVPIIMGRFDAKHFETGCGISTFWPVCSRPAGSNSFGMCDLAGNVWEWVMDSYRPNHEAVPVDGSPVLGGGLKVIRGGSFASSGRELRASTRGQQPANTPASYIGFRVARAYSVGEFVVEDDVDEFGL